MITRSSKQCLLNTSLIFRLRQLTRYIYEQFTTFGCFFHYLCMYVCLTFVRLLCQYLSVISTTLREVKFGNDQSMTINNRVAIPREY